MVYPDKISLDRPDVGGWETFISCPVFVDGNRPKLAGIEGKYKVEFILGVSTYQIDDVNIGFEAEGDSYIQFRNPDCECQRISLPLDTEFVYQ